MTKNNTSSEIAVEMPTAQRIAPSAYMRRLRPEYYSDTEDRALYVLDAVTLDHHLETVTSRNETHGFELFARKLCERAICPNLRPPTGPEGGGDGKVDTETYPVSDEITRVYIGNANSGRERWAFAFSAKKTWAKKARSDVKGIIDTGRVYDRIICVTARFARSKDRSRVEQELSTEYGVPVIIYDRSWIKTEIIEKDRKDIAFNYLGIGEVKSDPHQLGPTDYSRTRQLAEIERSFDDPEAYRGMERQRVDEALVAAKLSRNLERPRTETDGRFVRAIRLANLEGTYRQKLAAKYEQIWTDFWWFDDIRQVNESYSSFEIFALQTDHSSNLELLCNLFQLLVNAVIHGHVSPEECRLEEHGSRLQLALETIAENPARPNNSLGAQVSLLILRVNRALMNKQPDDLPDIWRDYTSILDRADGLAEFNAKRLISMIEVVGTIAGNDTAYNELIERLAQFVAKRTSEAEGAIILLKRARQLDLGDRIDMIRLLGKAAIGLSKKEYTDEFIEASNLLMLSYRSAGLLWAARASCILSAASIVIKGEEDSVPPVTLIPTMKVWAWIALELRLLPDVLFAIQILNGSLAALPLTDDSKEAVRNDIWELEGALGSLFLNLDDAELGRLSNLPDILEGLALFMARAALLYTLGYEALLREDGSVPQAEAIEDVAEIFSRLASQPVAKQLSGRLVLHEDNHQSLSTSFLGMDVEVEFQGGPQLTVVAETILGSLEAFFATVIDHHVAPHTEKYRINLSMNADVSLPTVHTSKLDMLTTVVWPARLSLISLQQRGEIGPFFAEIAGHVLGTACMIENISVLIDKLHDDESVQQRLMTVLAAPTSYHRVTSTDLSRLSDWSEVVHRDYPLQPPRPPLSLVNFELPDEDGADGEEAHIQPTSHRAIHVRSVVDVHAWDQARWCGAYYLEIGAGRIPAIALMFRDKSAAQKIFERWRDRFGERDVREEIHLSIIRNLPQQNPHHYVMLITSKLPDKDDRISNHSFVIANRSITMTPDNPLNLEQFLAGFDRSGEFYLLPAVVTSGVPDVIYGLALSKRHLFVKNSANVKEHDVEAMVIRDRN